MVFPDDDPGHWSRVFLWSGLAAITYPLLWLAYVGGDLRGFEEGYASLVTDGIVSFLTLFIGSALAIHYGTRQSSRLSPWRAIGYASVIAWFTVMIAVAWVFWSTRTSSDILATLVASPFLVVIAAPGFVMLGLAVWTERMFVYGRDAGRLRPRKEPAPRESEPMRAP